MNKEQFSKVFPIGSHLCREPMPPMSELKHDMEVLKNHGFNLIKLQEHWGIDEPAEGKYDFSRYEELISYAADLDLGVYLGLTCEQAPAWLWKKHPDCAMVSQTGVRITYIAQTTLPADGKPGPCFDHAGARADMVRFITKLVETLGHFENIVVWNTWQEIGYWGELTGNQVCFCEHTLNHYRTWLQERFGDLDNLNKAWNTRYADWLDVSPNRAAMMPCACDMAWRHFMDSVQIPMVLKTRYDAIKAADPLKRPVFAHKGSPIFASTQDWNQARSQDFMGSSFYPQWVIGNAWDDLRPQTAGPADKQEAIVCEMWDGVAMRFDQLRSCNVDGAPLWGAEFQGGPVGIGPFQKGVDIKSEEIRRWMLTAVGSGSTAISFWVTRLEIMAAECNGFGLLDGVGDTTERMSEASRIGLALNKHADLFATPSFTSSEVGILVNEDCFNMSSLASQGGGNLQYSTRGWHRLLWDLGIPVRFVNTNELDELSTDRIKTLIAPVPVCMSEETVASLTRYVESGGNLISEACPGRVDNYGFCPRTQISPIMESLFGVKHKALTSIKEPNNGKRWTGDPHTYGEYAEPSMLSGAGVLSDQVTHANVWLETYDCTDSDPCLYYNDSIAGVHRNHGKGQAFLLGTIIGHNGTAYKNDNTPAFVQALMQLCGEEPNKMGSLLVRKRSIGSKEALILTNPTNHEVFERIDAGNWQNVEDLLDEPIERNDKNLGVWVKPLDIRVLIFS